MKCAKTAFLHLNVTVDQYASQILQSCGHKEAKGSKNKKGGVRVMAKDPDELWGTASLRTPASKHLLI